MNTHSIDLEFLEFRFKLRNKRVGESLVFWQKSIDFLIVIIGDGDCRKYVVSDSVRPVYPYVDLLIKKYSNKGEDDFVGFKISGGIQNFLRHHYKKIIGKDFEEFALQHNSNHYEYHVSELLDMWTKLYSKHIPCDIDKIKRALIHQDPSIHIPL